jgi:ABC-2 type transport system permease protein
MSKNFNKPGQWRAYIAITWYALRAQTRNPATFAFGFIFPIVFISIFGLIGSQQKISVGIMTTSNTTNPIVSDLKKQSYVTIITDTQANLQKQLNKGKLAGYMDVQSGKISQTYTVSLFTSSANPIQAGQIQSQIKGIIDRNNLILSGVSNPPITYVQKEVASRASRYIDFALPGQIGFSLLSTAIFGTVFGLIYLKKALILKRMFATPTKAMTILVAQGTSRLVMALLQTILILAIGVFVFHFYLPHGFQTFIELIILSTFGLIAFLGFGYFMAGLSNDENSAGPLVNLVTLPQFLLSGTFFPTESLPMWLQPVANNLPLSYFNISARIITTEGGTLIQTWPYMAGLMAWGILMYILAAKTFRWQ